MRELRQLLHPLRHDDFFYVHDERGVLIPPLLIDFAKRWETPTARARELHPALQHLSSLYFEGLMVEQAKRSCKELADDAEKRGFQMVAGMWRRLSPKRADGRPQKISDRVLIANAMPLFAAMEGNKNWGLYSASEKASKPKAGQVEDEKRYQTKFQRFINELVEIIDPEREKPPSVSWYKKLRKEQQEKAQLQLYPR